MVSIHKHGPAPQDLQYNAQFKEVPQDTKKPILNPMAGLGKSRTRSRFYAVLFYD